MCNACGNVCCAMDTFSKCGCDDCHDPACWSDPDPYGYYEDSDLEQPEAEYYPEDESEE